MDPIVLNLLFTLLALLLGILIGHLYNRAARHDAHVALEQASRTMLNLLAENERLENEVEQMRDGLDKLGQMKIGETKE